MQKDFPAFMTVAKDERFVTTQHTLQSIWKAALEKMMQKRSWSPSPVASKAV